MEEALANANQMFSCFPRVVATEFITALLPHQKQSICFFKWWRCKAASHMCSSSMTMEPSKTSPFKDLRVHPYRKKKGEERRACLHGGLQRTANRESPPKLYCYKDDSGRAGFSLQPGKCSKSWAMHFPVVLPWRTADVLLSRAVRTTGKIENETIWVCKLLSW